MRTELKILELMGKKGEKENRDITQKEVANAIGLSEGAFGRLANKKTDRWDSDTLAKLYRYFGCKSMDELIEFIDDNRR